MSDDLDERDSDAGAEVHEKTSAEVLRERREKAMGDPIIDKEIHRSLPLTRAFPIVFLVGVIALALGVLGGKLGLDALYYGGRWSGSLLLIASIVVWFVSRSQAKTLTLERRVEAREKKAAAAASCSRERGSAKGGSSSNKRSKRAKKGRR